MKFLDFKGLHAFYKKIKASFAILNSSGKVPYNQLPDKVKKVKYIKKERRYFFHKSIPISFCINSGGNYNPQINGRYDDWYYSNQPVFKIARGKKFRLFTLIFGHDNNYNDLSNYIEVRLEDLTYWHSNSKKRVNLIEKSGDALICNKENIINDVNPTKHVNICFNKNSIKQFFDKSNTVHIKQVNYEKSTDTYYIYVIFKTMDKPIPYNKNLKWVGNKIECILPTNNFDVYHTLYFYNRFYRYNDDGCIIKYYKKFNRSLRLVKRRLVGYKTPIPRKTFIAIAKHHYYNKQPSKFRLNFSSFRQESGLYIEHAIKKVE